MTGTEAGGCGAPRRWGATIRASAARRPGQDLTPLARKSPATVAAAVMTHHICLSDRSAACMPGNSGGSPKLGDRAKAAKPERASAGTEMLVDPTGHGVLQEQLPQQGAKPDQVKTKVRTVKPLRTTTENSSSASWASCAGRTGSPLDAERSSCATPIRTSSPVSYRSASTISGWIRKNCRKATARPVTAPAITPPDSRDFVMSANSICQWQGKPVAWRVSCVAACSASEEAKPAAKMRNAPRTALVRMGRTRPACCRDEVERVVADMMFLRPSHPTGLGLSLLSGRSPGSRSLQPFAFPGSCPVAYRRDTTAYSRGGG